MAVAKVRIPTGCIRLFPTGYIRLSTAPVSAQCVTHNTIPERMSKKESKTEASIARLPVRTNTKSFTPRRATLAPSDKFIKNDVEEVEEVETSSWWYTPLASLAIREEPSSTSRRNGVGVGKREASRSKVWSSDWSSSRRDPSKWCNSWSWFAARATMKSMKAFCLA